MSGGFHVEPEQLESHSRSVDQIADSVGEAGSAGASELFGGLVYGVLWDALAVPPLALWANHINDLMAQNADLGHHIAAALKSNADTYAGVEQSNLTTVQQSGPS